MRRLFIYILLIALTVAPAGAAKKITNPDEALENARAAFEEYNTGEAREMYDLYSSLMRKKKRDIPADVEDEISRTVLMENMLSRVEKIVIVDSLTVDSADFFLNYRLSAEAGRIVKGETVRMPGVTMAFVPQNNTEILYAAEDSAGWLTLMGADVLDDGTVESPAPLVGDNLSGGGNAAFPFLMSDGQTLYFAADGEGSLGGYDIFLTRRDDDGTYLQPQNIGMPYNSPYNDFMLAIDETTGAGWWATDRNMIPGKVTIYVFEPTETRVNVDIDDPNLTALARIDDIGLTGRGADVQKIKANIAAAEKNRNESESGESAFELVVGNAGRIYNNLSDFRSKTARAAMAKAMDATIEINRIGARLDELRKKWAQGDKSQSVTILNLEQQLEDARQRKADYINTAIADELMVLGK